MKTETFDSETWKAQRGVDTSDNKRGRMVVALGSVIRAGASRASVVQVLGEPDQVDAASGNEVYEIGASAYGIDEEYIEVHYQDGKVESYRLMRR